MVALPTPALHPSELTFLDVPLANNGPLFALHLLALVDSRGAPLPETVRICPRARVRPEFLGVLAGLIEARRLPDTLNVPLSLGLSLSLPEVWGPGRPCHLHRYAEVSPALAYGFLNLRDWARAHAGTRRWTLESTGRHCAGLTREAQAYIERDTPRALRPVLVREGSPASVA